MLFHLFKKQRNIKFCILPNPQIYLLFILNYVERLYTYIALAILKLLEKTPLFSQATPNQFKNSLSKYHNTLNLKKKKGLGSAGTVWHRCLQVPLAQPRSGLRELQGKRMMLPRPGTTEWAVLKEQAGSL